MQNILRELISIYKSTSGSDTASIINPAQTTFALRITSPDERDIRSVASRRIAHVERRVPEELRRLSQTSEITPKLARGALRGSRVYLIRVRPDPA